MKGNKKLKEVEKARVVFSLYFFFQCSFSLPWNNIIVWFAKKDESFIHVMEQPLVGKHFVIVLNAFAFSLLFYLEVNKKKLSVLHVYRTALPARNSANG